MKTCIVYYSFSGITRDVARKVAASCGGDLIEVLPRKPYSKLTAYTLGCMRARRGGCDPITPDPIDVTSYDCIVVGTPVWAFRAVPPVNSAVTALSGCDGKKAVVFATCGGNAGDTLPEIKKALEARGVRVTGSMVLTGNDIRDNQRIEELTALVNAAETA